MTCTVRGDRIQIAVHTLHSRKGTTIAGALVADVGAHLVSSVAVRSPCDFLGVQPLAVGTLTEIPRALRGRNLTDHGGTYHFVIDTTYT